MKGTSEGQTSVNRTSKLMTLLTTIESKIQDKDRSIMHVNSFLHAAGGYFLESPNNYLVTRISLLLTLSSNDFPHSSYSFWSRMVFGC